MALFTSHAPGTPSWVDLMTTDLDAAKGFYGALFGWDLEDQFDDDANRVYVMAKLDGKAVAGMGAMPPGAGDMASLWNTYITVADVARSVDAVTAAGGQVVMAPMQLMESGHMAVCADPAGAAFSMWQPEQHIGIEVGNVANTLTWNELMSRDIDTAKGFYAEVFGWNYEEGAEMPGYHLIAGGENGGLGGLMAMPPEVPDMVPSHWVAYFAVADLPAAMATATGAGASVMVEPMIVPGVGSFATVSDPSGAALSLMQPEDLPTI